MDFDKYKLSEKQFKGEAPIADAASTPIWNRLEVSPRNPDSTAAFKAEVRDALWMLTRQWQLGEFVGDDAGSLAFTNLSMRCSYLNSQDNIPLEAMVEQQQVFENTSNRAVNLQFRLLMGSYWLKLLGKYNLGSLSKEFIMNPSYKISLPENISNEIYAVQIEDFMGGKCFDGWKFYSDPNRFNGFSSNISKLEDLFKKMQAWYLRHIQQPEGDTSQWQAGNLEYQFSTKLPVKNLSGNNYKEYELGTKEYYQGKLDWFHFEVQNVANVQGNSVLKAPTDISYPDPSNRNLIPGPVSFDGMPEKRYWAIEDSATNFAAIKLDKLDFGKMALVEFGLIYSNDWNLVPVKLPVGSFAQVNSFEVVDTFGKKTNIPATGNASQTTWKDWQFFSINSKVSESLQGMLLAPTTADSQHSKPVEEVVFIRDEVANLMWGIETVIPNILGSGISGREVGTQDQTTSKGSNLTYIEQTSVPKNWIPFVSVQHPTLSKVVVSRRGSMLDDKNQHIRPFTALLRKGIESDETQTSSYDINENEVGREGVIVRKSYQRTRWYNGETFVWLGIQKTAGKGEGASRLAFDQLESGGK